MPSSNRVDVWVDTALECADFLHATYEDFAFPPHLHETFAIGIIERGVQRFSSGRGRHELMSEGTICVINPGEVHEGRSGDYGGWRYRMFYPSMSLVARALSTDPPGNCGSVPSLDSHVLQDGPLFRDFLALHLASRGKEDLLERETRTLLFVRALFSRHAGALKGCPADGIGPRGLPKTVQIVRQVLHDCCERAISIGELAREAAVSETQVIRSFSRSMGIAPHAYLIALRVEAAKRLIRSGLPLAEVAARCSFTDQSHLTRHFRRHTGMTPGHFARASRL